MNAIQKVHDSGERGVVLALLGPLGLGSFLEDKSLFEIVINRPGQVLTEGIDGWRAYNVPSLTFEKLLRLARAIGSFSDQMISEQNPVLSATLPGNERIQIVMPPATPKDTISITIRKPSTATFDLEQLLEKQLFEITQNVGSAFGGKDGNVDELGRTDRELFTLLEERNYVDFLRLAVRTKQNILISGATGSGKTTLSKALIAEIPRDERILTIEDTPELVIPHENCVRLFYSKGGQGTAQVGAKELLESGLRMRPDRILLQELRDGTAFYYIRNVNSGHPGSITTVHASSAMLAFEQMTLLMKELEGGQDLARDDIRSLLVTLIDVIIQCKRVEGKFRVTEIYFDPFRKLHHAATGSCKAPAGRCHGRINVYAWLGLRPRASRGVFQLGAPRTVQHPHPTSPPAILKIVGSIAVASHPRRQASSSPRPLSRLAVVKELSLSGAVGKRGAGSVPRKVKYGAFPAPRRWSCPIVGAPAVAFAGAGEPRNGPGPRMKISSRVSATRPARHRRPP